VPGIWDRGGSHWFWLKVPPGNGGGIGFPLWIQELDTGYLGAGTGGRRVGLRSGKGVWFWVLGRFVEGE